MCGFIPHCNGNCRIKLVPMLYWLLSIHTTRQPVYCSLLWNHCLPAQHGSASPSYKLHVWISRFFFCCCCCCCTMLELAVLFTFKKAHLLQLVYTRGLVCIPWFNISSRFANSNLHMELMSCHMHINCHVACIFPKHLFTYTSHVACRVKVLP